MQEEITDARSAFSQSLATKGRTNIVVLLGIVGLLHGISLAQAASQAGERGGLTALPRLELALASSESESNTTKEIGDEVQWTEYQDIETDDCVSILFVGTVCHHVTYKFEFRGKVASINHQNQEYNVALTSRKVIPQETVSPMYWAYVDRAQQWADQQEYRTVGFSDIE